MLGRHADVTTFGIENDFQPKCRRVRHAMMQHRDARSPVTFVAGRLELDHRHMPGNGIQHIHRESIDRFSPGLWNVDHRTNRRWQPLEDRIESDAHRRSTAFDRLEEPIGGVDRRR